MVPDRRPTDSRERNGPRAPEPLGAELIAPSWRCLPRFIARPIARWLALDWVNHVYNQTRDAPDADVFAAGALRHMGIDFDVDPAEVAQIPRRGRLIVIANHPLGCADALILCQILGAARPDA